MSTAAAARHSTAPACRAEPPTGGPAAGPEAGTAAGDGGVGAGGRADRTAEQKPAEASSDKQAALPPSGRTTPQSGKPPLQQTAPPPARDSSPHVPRSAEVVSAQQLTPAPTAVTASALDPPPKYLLNQLKYRLDIQDPLALYEAAKKDSEEEKEGTAVSVQARIVYAVFLRNPTAPWKDHELALKLLTAAANTEPPEAPDPLRVAVAIANSLLGDWYRRGIVCATNYNISFKHLKRGADLGDHTALAAVAEMYERGAGTPRDEGKAFFYYRKSADADCLRSIFKVAQCYETGKGAPINYYLSKRYYRLGAARNHFPSLLRLAALSLDPSSETFENLAAAVPAAKTPRTMHNCAIAHSTTKHGARPDFVQMRKWLLKAAQMGHARSQWLLAKIHQDGRVAEGESGKMNATRAFYWFHRAALQGYQPAQLAVSALYRTGTYGVMQDLKLADTWHKAATRCGCQKVRPEAYDLACVSMYSLTEASGPVWNGQQESDRVFDLLKSAQSPATTPLVSGGPALPPLRFDVEKPTPTPAADVFSSTDGFKDMASLIASFGLKPDQLLQDRNARVPTMKVLTDYATTYPTSIPSFLAAKRAFIAGEKNSMLQRHAFAIKEYAAGFRSLTGFFDLESADLKLLAATSIQHVLTAKPKHADALLVDAFLNMLTRPPELGIIACNRVLDAAPTESVALILRGGYRARCYMFDEAIEDFGAALRIEQQATEQTKVKDLFKIKANAVMAEALFQLGVAHSNLEGREHRVASVRYLMMYLHATPLESKRTADAHYTIAASCLSLSHPDKLISHFSSGLEAESCRPHFLPPILNADLKARLTLEVRYAVVTGRTHVRSLPWAALPLETMRMIEGELGAEGSITRECLACGSTRKTKTCAGCKIARYCSTNCQIAHWIRGHRAECNPNLLSQAMPVPVIAPAALTAVAAKSATRTTY
ncbi:hypothetical protein HDU90_003432 [Geranomyces variabilis]|nr:hypothetical protein HDU90_003432 [Geranomyces variabilis]